MDKEVRKIYFDEKYHKYYDDRAVLYTSVTQTIGRFKTNFDKEFWSTAKAIERLVTEKDGYVAWNSLKQQAGGYKELITILLPRIKADNKKSALLLEYKEEVLKEWEKKTYDGCFRGSTIHSYLETNVNKATGFIKNVTTKEVFTIVDLLQSRYNEITIEDLTLKTDLKETYPKIYKFLCSMVEQGFLIYAEIGVYSYDYLISGTIDILLFHPERLSFCILDWKTNLKELHFQAGYYKKFNGIETTCFVVTDERFLFPLSHIPLCKGEEYTLQLSTYAFLTEQYGLTCEGLVMAHIRDDVEFHEISYRKSDVRLMLNAHLQYGEYKSNNQSNH